MFNSRITPWYGSRPPSSDKRRPAACCRVRRRLQPAPLVKAGCYVPPCHLFSLQDPVSRGPPPTLCGGEILLHGVSLNGGRQTGVRWVLGRSCFSGPLEIRTRMGCVRDAYLLSGAHRQARGAPRHTDVCAGACGNTAYSRRLDMAAKQTRAGRADRTWAGSRCQSCRG